MRIKVGAESFSLMLSYVMALVLLAAGTLDLLGYDVGADTFFYNTILFLPVVVISLNAVAVLGVWRALFLMISATVFGLFIEFLGMNYAGFGDRYAYHTNIFSIYGVPFVVPLYWFFFLYLSYSVTNARVVLSDCRKPAGVKQILPLVLWDVVSILSIDIAMDPLQVYAGNWAWFQPGIYFGVPISNFVGWALWSALFLFCLRMIDIKYPYSVAGRFSLTFPVYIYATLAVLFLMVGVRTGIPETVISGVTLMLMVIYKPIRLDHLQRRTYLVT